MCVGTFDIGYAALSSLISKVRDPEPDLAAHASLLRGLLRSAWTVHRSMIHYLETHAVDRAYVFNGRFAPMRAVLRACQEKAVDCYTHERGCDLKRYILLPNTTIHDIETVHRIIWETWDAASANPDREQIARQWYETRARGEDDISLVRGQRCKRLPSGWDGDKRNITVFAPQRMSGPASVMNGAIRSTSRRTRDCKPSLTRFEPIRETFISTFAHTRIFPWSTTFRPGK